MLKNILQYGSCHLYAVGKHICKIPVILTVSAFSIKIDKIVFFNLKQDESKYPIISGLKLNISRGEKYE